MKKASKKPIIIAVAITAVLAAIILAVGTQKSHTVVFTDSYGESIGSVTYDGKSKRITAAEDGYRDYINLALEEAISFYSEKTDFKDEDKIGHFFSSVAAVDTNLDKFYYEKIRDGFSEADLEDDTPFASVMVDGNGRVLASYGYTDKDTVGYSLNKTYAGSSIKPLSVYTPAIESGRIHWSSAVKDSPVKKVRYENTGETDWPQNANGIYTNENMLICDAVYKSTNTVAVKTLQTLGVESSISFLTEKLNLQLDSEKKILEQSKEDEIYGNLALGYLIDGVSPLDMAGYYQIFMNGGKYTEPWAVRSVTDIHGETIRKTPESKKVISAATATVMTKLLQGVVQPGGTGADANVRGMSIAGKTGTSEDNRDNWFIGYTPKFVCSVWHGFNDDNVNGSHLIFNSILGRFEKTNTSFNISKEARTLIYCKKSGGIRGAHCTDTAIGYYLNGSIPKVCTECR